MIQSQWVQFPASGSKRKRAELACALCHGKKIRCDLQSRRDEGHNNCTNCVSASKDCCLRPSKRDVALRGPENCRLSNLPVGSNGTNRNGTNRNGASPQSSIVVQSNVGSGISNSEAQNSTGHAGAEMHDDLLDMTAGHLFQPQDSVLDAQRTFGMQSPAHSRSNQASVLSSTSTANWRATEPAQLENSLLDTRLPQSSGLEDVDVARHQLISEWREPNHLDVSHSELQPSFAETYFEYCYPWCPVLDKSTLFDELAKSPLLGDALAVLGSNLRPPMIPHPGPATYYTRARRKFYDDEEPDLLISLKAVLLFYWWAPQPPSVVHRHSSWWWTSVVIRHAQQAGFHRDNNSELVETDIDRGLQRRIWWTAFSRERLTAICQGKPCLIDPEDCNVPEPSLADFPDLEDKTQAEVFIYWVRLCSIIGRIAKELPRSSNSNSTTNTFPTHLASELIEWVQSLPPHLQLPIKSAHTGIFNRAVHQLHLPYLAIVVVLHVTRSSLSLSLPQALPPAILAGSCIARILKDVLMRSEIGYLMPITCWYSGMAFIALLQASKTEHLRDGANADLEIVTLAVKQMKKMWGTAEVFDKGFERLHANDKSLEDFPNRHLTNDRSPRALNSEEGVISNGIDWLDYFPFATSQTSLVAEKLLVKEDIDFFPWDIMADSTMLQFQGFFEGLGTWGEGNTLF